MAVIGAATVRAGYVRCATHGRCYELARRRPGPQSPTPGEGAAKAGAIACSSIALEILSRWRTTDAVRPPVRLPRSRKNTLPEPKAAIWRRLRRVRHPLPSRDARDVQSLITIPASSTMGWITLGVDMRYWRRHQTAKTAWLHGQLPASKARLYEAIARGQVIPKDPAQVQATPPQAIGVPPRLALIRQRATVLRARGQF